MTTLEGLVSTVNEIAAALKLGRTKTYQLINTGRLEKIKVGTKTLVTNDSVLRYLEDLRTEAAHDGIGASCAQAPACACEDGKQEPA